MTSLITLIYLIYSASVVKVVTQYYRFDDHDIKPPARKTPHPNITFPSPLGACRSLPLKSIISL